MASEDVTVDSSVCVIMNCKVLSSAVSKNPNKFNYQLKTCLESLYHVIIYIHSGGSWGGGSGGVGKDDDDA
jgi:hypothetical protein